MMFECPDCFGLIEYRPKTTSYKCVGCDALITTIRKQGLGLKMAVSEVTGNRRRETRSWYELRKEQAMRDGITVQADPIATLRALRLHIERLRKELLEKESLYRESLEKLEAALNEERAALDSGERTKLRAVTP